jgi:hypothetical protein
MEPWGDVEIVATLGRGTRVTLSAPLADQGAVGEEQTL